MTNTYSKTLLYKCPITGTEFYACDDNSKSSDNYGIDELDLFDMLDEDEEE